MNQLLDGARRVLGLVLLVLVVVPVYLVLDAQQPLSPQGLMRATGADHWRFAWGAQGGGWTLLVLGVGLGLGAALGGRFTRALAFVGRWIEAPPRWSVALLAAATGAALTWLVAGDVFAGRTIVNDASVQLIQARYFAAGHLAGPPLVMPEFWSIQFMVHTAAGWVSQYPPMHALLLAGGFKLGAPWITMAIAMAVLGCCCVVAFERLLPKQIATARIAAFLSVMSPLMLSLAGSYMNHVTVAALAALALVMALKAEEGGLVWAGAAGVAMGAMVATRPVSGLAIGLVLTAGIWMTGERHAEGWDRPWLLRRLGAWALGGLPFAIGLGWFNARFFGSPLTLGYVAASGPNHGLGFHEDPWGRLYTATQALGFTSTELISLGRELLGAPLPIAAFVGLFLLITDRLNRGERILVAWATLPVLASALYWHHDLIFGPRMLGGAAPAWCALSLVAAAGLAKASRRDWARDAIAIVLLAAAVYAAALGAPGRVTRHAARLAPLPVVTTEPSLVFVHEQWPDRLGGRLAGRGMRLDSVRHLLMNFNECQLEAAFVGGQVRDVAPRCQLEFNADSLLGLGLTNYIWLDDLPGLQGEGVLWARDLGPEANARLLESNPERTPLFVLPVTRGAEWRVVPYDEGIARLWGGVLAEEETTTPDPESTPPP